VKHYDCYSQRVKVEQFYGAESQLQLLVGIASWWVETRVNKPTAIMDAIKLEFDGDEGGKWGAVIHWSE